MEQYIPKAPIVAEIDSIAADAICQYNSDKSRYAEGVIDVVHRIKHLLNILEVKEVDLDEEIKSYFKGFGKFPSVGIDDCIDIAKHFFELGLNAQQK
jgi:hypothetical protein